MSDGTCPVKVIVLTLKRAKARQARIKSLLDSAGIPFEFFWGVDGQRDPNPIEPGDSGRRCHV